MIPITACPPWHQLVTFWLTWSRKKEEKKKKKKKSGGYLDSPQPVFEKEQGWKNEEYNEGFPRPGGNFVAHGNKNIVGYGGGTSKLWGR
jgi:hypothetical protein